MNQLVLSSGSISTTYAQIFFLRDNYNMLQIPQFKYFSLINPKELCAWGGINSPTRPLACTNNICANKAQYVDFF